MKKSTQESSVCIRGYICRSPPPACQYTGGVPPPAPRSGEKCDCPRRLSGRYPSYAIHTPQAISYELQATSFETQVTSYELRSVACKNPPALADDSTVRYLAVECLYSAESNRKLIKFSYPSWSAPADDCTVQVLYRKIISRYKLDF